MRSYFYFVSSLGSPEKGIKGKYLMIIDFHTHSFPDAIAPKAIDRLSAASDTKAYTDGTLAGLREGMKAAGIDLSVLMPVVTAPTQHRTINRVAVEINQKWQETGVMSFGGIHPDNADYKEILRHLALAGIRGIKLHPIFQGCSLDDIRFLRIIDCACENGLYVLTHAGFDIAFPGVFHASPPVIRRMYDQVKPDKLILAHMGGWGQWQEAEELLLELPVWLDTSTCLTGMEHIRVTNPKERKFPPEMEQLSVRDFERMVRKLGAERILMGSDSPWTPQDASLKAIQKSALTDKEKGRILGENAEKILF